MLYSIYISLCGGTLRDPHSVKITLYVHASHTRTKTKKLKFQLRLPRGRCQRLAATPNTRKYNISSEITPTLHRCAPK